jgi:hypothetical protein
MLLSLLVVLPVLLPSGLLAETSGPFALLFVRGFHTATA